MLSLLACSDGNEPKPVSCATSQFPNLPLVEGQGVFIGAATGSISWSALGNAGSYQHGTAAAAFTVMNGYQLAAGQVSGELFILVRSAAVPREVQLVPVTLAQLDDPEFFPTGAIAAYGDDYDSAVKKYRRWFLAKSGCVRIKSSTPPTPAAAGEVNAIATLIGEWRSNTNQLLGSGTMYAELVSPLEEFRPGVGAAPDSMRASVTGVRAAPFSPTGGLDAFQVLRPEQTRLVIVGTQAADTTRELWLSVAGRPNEGDSIPLGSVTLAEARATRANPPRSFAMLRMLEFQVAQPVVREIWISSDGYVKFNRSLQNGPLGLCGEMSGTFAFTAQGTSLANPGTSLGTSTVSSGAFKTRMTVLSQSDTLTDPALLPAAAPNVFRPASPTSTMGFGCP